MRRYWLFSQFGTQLTKGHKWDVLSQLWGAGWNCVPIDFRELPLAPHHTTGAEWHCRTVSAARGYFRRFKADEFQTEVLGQTLPQSLYIILNVAWPTEGS